MAKHKIKSPTRKKNKRAISEDLEKFGLTLSQAEGQLLEAADLASDMASAGYGILKGITDLSESRWVDEFSGHALCDLWFGEVTKKSQVKKVRNRMDSICNRIQRGLTIRFRPQKERTHDAHNRGTFFEPSTFKVFPFIFDEDMNYIASTYIHELMHVWFKDQKLGMEPVYGDQAALDLAKYHPRRARKSAENYAFFCEEALKNK